VNALADIFSSTYATEDGLCFVILPFNEDLEEIYERILRPVVSGEPILMRCVRGDEIFSNKPIMGDVWEWIQKAEIIIADLTGKNPNVMYELGLAHALWKKVILIAQSVDDLPFDLRHLRTIVYKHNIKGTEALARDLSAAIVELRGLPSNAGAAMQARDSMDGLDEFSGLRVIAKNDATRARALIKRGVSTQIKYPGLTISISLISVDEDGFSKLSIGYEFESPVLTESLRIELYPSSSTSVLSRSVRIFYVMLIAVDIARKSAVVEVVPTPPTVPLPAATA
jgi:nucleoside 2-deoxyribosyltransferase